MKLNSKMVIGDVIHVIFIISHQELLVEIVEDQKLEKMVNLVIGNAQSVTFSTLHQETPAKNVKTRKKKDKNPVIGNVQVVNLQTLVKMNLVKIATKKKDSHDKRLRYELSKNIKAGDWMCSCSFVNYASRTKCKECNTEKSSNETTKLTLDWNCKKCNFVNFSKNELCKGCQAKKE